MFYINNNRLTIDKYFQNQNDYILKRIVNFAYKTIDYEVD